ncbi:MAG: hypothetical protein ABSB15_10535, partial [Bryobacteraceae bacterium]
LDNAEVKENIGTDEDREKPWTAKLHELCGVIVGSNGDAGTSAFLNNAKIELGSGAWAGAQYCRQLCQFTAGMRKGVS